MRKAAAALTLLAAVAVLMFTAATPAYADPPGFNGTVKIHEEPGEAEPITQNEPHVCVFHVHGFNFDANATGWYRIDGWAPTAGNTGRGQTNWGPASAAGEWKSVAITLAPGHYKLFFDQTAPQAPGGEKHKVFWVECESQGTTARTSTPAATPVVTPVGTPAATPVGTPAATPVGTPAATQVGTPVATPVGTPVATPVGTPAATPVVNAGSNVGGAVTTGQGAAVAGVQTAPQPAAPNTGVLGVQTLPSTSTENTNGLLGLGAAIMLIGGLLMCRKPLTT